MLAYLQKPAVQMTLFLTAVGAAGVFFYYQSTAGRTSVTTTKPPPEGMGQASAEKVSVGRRDLKGSQTVENTKLDKLVLPPLKNEPPTIIKEKETTKVVEKPKSPVFPDLVQLRSTESLKPFNGAPPSVFAPRGTLIKAALVITLESNAVGTPVVAMVSEDVYFQGKLIVPAGTQIIASASSVSSQNSGEAGGGGGSNSGATKFRDRIDIRGAFTFVWADGSEYVINGIALDHEPLSDGTFALTDGSPGIKGRILKTDDYAELKIIISEMVQGFMKNQQSSFKSIYGLVPDDTSRNAALGSGASGASAYSNLLVKKLEKDLEYVQVPEGTLFYLYTLDVFEPELRSVGALRQGNSPRSGIQLQQEAYAQVAAAALQNAGDLKARVEEARILEAAAKQQSLLDRTKALISTSASQPPTTNLPPPRQP